MTCLSSTTTWGLCGYDQTTQVMVKLKPYSDQLTGSHLNNLTRVLKNSDFYFFLVALAIWHIPFRSVTYVGPILIWSGSFMNSACPLETSWACVQAHCLLVLNLIPLICPTFESDPPFFYGRMEESCSAFHQMQEGIALACLLPAKASTPQMQAYIYSQMKKLLGHLNGECSKLQRSHCLLKGCWWSEPLTISQN